MSKQQLKAFITQQLEKLNKKIDAKIILGQDWNKESVEHSKLRKQLINL